MQPRRILLTSSQCPGDFLVMSAAIRDIHLAYPGKFEVMTGTLQEQIFEHNPNIKRFARNPHVKEIKGTYSNRLSVHSIHNSNSPSPRTHFLWGYIGDLNKALGLNIKLTELRPDVHLTEEEKKTPPIEKPYWVFASGGKNDFTAKWWDPEHWQTTVDLLKGHKLVQVGGGSHVHPYINGAVDMVRKTTFRQLMRLIYHSEGVLCVVTCLMHLAAAFNKPCVVVAGGREPPWWEAYTHETRLHNIRFGFPEWNPPVGDNYVPHRFLHTINQLPCCLDKGCWKSKLTGPRKDKNCVDVVNGPSASIPHCLQIITPEMVADSVDWYYREGILNRTIQTRLILPQTAPTAALPKKEKAKLTIAAVVNTGNPTRMRFLQTLRNQEIEDCKVTVICCGADNKISDFARYNGWEFVQLTASANRKEVWSEALKKAEGMLTVITEEGLPVSTTWAKAALKDTSSVYGQLCWQPAVPSDLESFKNKSWYRHREVEKMKQCVNAVKLHRVDHRFIALPKELVEILSSDCVTGVDEEAIIGEYLWQQNRELRMVDQHEYQY